MHAKENAHKKANQAPAPGEREWSEAWRVPHWPDPPAHIQGECDRLFALLRRYGPVEGSALRRCGRMLPGSLSSLPYLKDWWSLRRPPARTKNSNRGLLPVVFKASTRQREELEAWMAAGAAEEKTGAARLLARATLRPSGAPAAAGMAHRTKPKPKSLRLSLEPMHIDRVIFPRVNVGLRARIVLFPEGS